MQKEQFHPIEESASVAQLVSLHELPAADPKGGSLLEGNLSLISDVKVKVEVLVGSAELTVEELFSIKKGSVMSLDQLHHAPVTVRLHGKAIARGDLVVVGDNFGVRIAEIVPSNKAVEA